MRASSLRSGCQLFRDHGIRYEDWAVAKIENSREARGSEAIARVRSQDRIFDDQLTGAVVRHKEDGGPALVGVVVLDERAEHAKGHFVSVVVDGCATATTGSARALRIRPPTCGFVVRKQAIDDGPRHTDGADPARVRTFVSEQLATAEGAADYVHRPVLILTEDPDRSAADVRTGGIAPVVGEHRIHDLELAAAHPDRSAPVGIQSGRITLSEREVLNGELWMVLILAMWGRPHEVGIARIHIEDPGRAASAERNQPATVDHDLWAGVIEHSGGFRHHDRIRIRPAIERNDSPESHGFDDGRRGA